MNAPSLFALCSFLLTLSFTPFVASADEVAVRGRAILNEHRDAVVTIALVVQQRMSFPGSPSRSEESKSEATGTVISPTGLTILSLSETDPSALLEAMMGPSGPQGLKMETEIVDVRIMLRDGTEIPAEVILRDKDLDMAFLRPVEKPDSPFAYVDLTLDSEPEILDQLITINRLGKVAGRAHSASVERVDAIVERPRTFYIPGMNPTNTNLGCPAFALDGKIVGFFLMRAIRTGGSGGRSMFGGGNDSVRVIILPARDVLEAAAQVPEYSE